MHLQRIDPHGTVEYDYINNKVIYTPDPGYSGDDYFYYWINDGQNNAYGRVNVTIEENIPPIAVDDRVSTDVNTPITIDVLDNDFDLGGGTLALGVVPGTSPKEYVPRHGTVEYDYENNTITYTPNSGYQGADGFGYYVNDGADDDLGWVNIIVGDELVRNQPPTAVNDEVTTPRDTSITVNVLDNDYDLGGNEIFLGGIFGSGHSGTPPEHGTVEYDYENNTITYTPDDDFVGEDAFGYYVNDGQYDDPATVTVTVTDGSIIVTTGEANNPIEIV